MAHYLLYDGACSMCSDMAERAHAMSDGRLGIRDLYDPEVKALLDSHHPGWTWEPMVLEMDSTGTRVKIYEGLAMRARLVLVLGIHRAWKIARMVQQSNSTVLALGVGMSRRTFMRKASGVVAGVAFLPLAGKAAEALEKAGGGGFPEVECYTRCNSGTSQCGSQYRKCERYCVRPNGSEYCDSGWYCTWFC